MHKKKSKTLSKFAGLLCLTLGYTAGCQASPVDTPLSGQQITTGLGMGIMYEAQLGQASNSTLSDRYEVIYGDEIESAGFDSVRIRLDMENFTASSSAAPSYTLSNEFMTDLQFIVDDLLSRKNNTMHVLISPKGLENGLQESIDAQVAWWGQIAEHFQHHSHRLIFNLMNEPRINPNAGEFSNYDEINNLYVALTNKIRLSNPTRYIVYYQLYETFDGPGETDFYTYPLPDGAAPYAIVDTHILGDPDAEGEAKRMGKLRAAWEYREINDIPVWSGAWQMGSHANGYDLEMGQRVTDEFVARGIPGIYLMFNGGQTSIYDSAGLDRDNDGVNYEWTRPEIRDIVTSAGEIVWNKGAVHSVVSTRAQDDSYTSSSAPDTVKGNTSDLQVKAIKSAFLKFPLQRLPQGDVTQAFLKLFVVSAQGPAQIDVHVTEEDSWDEATLTYNNSPVYGPAISSFSVDTDDVGTWLSIDVSEVPLTNTELTLVLTTVDGNLVKFHSRDGDFSSNPDLIITVDTGVTPPTATEVIEDFETANLDERWTTSGNVSVGTGGASSGDFGLILKENAAADISIDSSGLSQLVLSYDRKTVSLSNKEKLKVQWSIDGENWQLLESSQATSWQTTRFDLPLETEQQSHLKIRFSTNANRTTEKALIDNIRLTGHQL